MSGLGGNGDTGNEPDLSLGEGEPDSGGADLSTDNDTGYESGSMEETALKTLREIQARGGDEADEGDEGDGKTIKVKEHVRKVKGGAGDASWRCASQGFADHVEARAGDGVRQTTGGRAAGNSSARD
jgi:hypothetical protein